MGYWGSHETNRSFIYWPCFFILLFTILVLFLPFFLFRKGRKEIDSTQPGLPDFFFQKSQFGLAKTPLFVPYLAKIPCHFLGGESPLKSGTLHLKTAILAQNSHSWKPCHFLFRFFFTGVHFKIWINLNYRAKNGQLWAERAARCWLINLSRTDVINLPTALCAFELLFDNFGVCKCSPTPSKNSQILSQNKRKGQTASKRGCKKRLAQLEGSASQPVLPVQKPSEPDPASRSSGQQLSG